MFERKLNRRTRVYPSPHSCHVKCVLFWEFTCLSCEVFTVWLTLSLFMSVSTRRAVMGSYGSMRRSSVKCPWLLSWLRTCKLLMCWHASSARTGAETHKHTHTHARVSHAFTSSVAYFFFPLRSLIVKRGDLSLYEIGGNISKCGFTIFSVHVITGSVEWNYLLFQRRGV